MQINISNLSEGTHTYDLSENAQKLGLESNFHESVDAHVTLEKSMNQLLLTVNASVKGVFVCDRCAREFEETVKTKFTTIYSWENDETMEEEDDYHVLRPDENIIDISQNVTEYLRLSVPLKLLCSKSDCQIPGYETDEKSTIDPRWEQLQKLLKQENK